ncbi:MAG TPA: DUF481 domain-containing protein [Candidatus Dormibacteraeota bacterium]|nr:DUF481 domain-containing protein [Candidatus Dormibacteraeota bacterium]
MATAAVADDVTSKGTVLKGKVTGMSSAGLTLEPEYGKGTLAIDWKDIEDVKTDGPFQVLYGDNLEADAPVQGFSDGKVLVGGAAETATAIAVADLHSAVPIGPDGLTWKDELRSAWRYWDGSADFGLSAQQATTDTFGMLFGIHTTRIKAPTRFSIGGDYRYSNQKQQDGDKTSIEDRAFGSIRDEYDLTERFYVFGSGDATYDAIQKLSIRGVPKLGVGYLLWEEKLAEPKRNFLAVEVGGAWVYEDYFNSTGTPANDYFAVALGAAAAYYFPYDIYLGWRVDYLPAVDDFTNDYLLRNALELSAPLIDPVSAKFSLLDEYDNTPAAGAVRNSLYLAFGLSVGW